MVLFALYFPVPFDFVRSRPWLNWVVAAPWIVLGAIRIYGGIERERHIHELGRFALLWTVAHYTDLLAFGVYLSAYFMLLAAKKRAHRASVIARQLNITIAGSLLSLLPFVAIVLSDLHILARLPTWIAAISFSMTLLFPITVARVFLVQRDRYTSRPEADVTTFGAGLRI